MWHWGVSQSTWCTQWPVWPNLILWRWEWGGGARLEGSQMKVISAGLKRFTSGSVSFILKVLTGSGAVHDWGVTVWEHPDVFCRSTKWKRTSSYSSSSSWCTSTRFILSEPFDFMSVCFRLGSNGDLFCPMASSPSSSVLSISTTAGGPSGQSGRPGLNQQRLCRKLCE